MRFSIMTTNQSWLTPELEKLDATRFDALYVVDHPAFPTPDPWTWLAYAAARTQRIRLGTHVTGAPFHHPTQLAKQVATVDQLSSGRAILGIGTAYEIQDFEPYGFAMPGFQARVGMLDETLRILQMLWSGKSEGFEGLHHRLVGFASFEPRPVQDPHPPIIVGLNRQGRLLRIAAERADGINTWQLGPRQITELRPHVRMECERAGRPADSLRLTSDVLLARGANRTGAEDLASMVRDMARSWGRDEKVTDWDSGGILYGSADDMRDQALRFRDAGVSELCLSVHSMDEVTWFDEEVIAHFAE
jgi:alkanesulfonate monooxygenase SsuD/methylene tetrahydromethanopterin reductase-like flavin-dependent oxidoreductase (luciferase family)